MLKWNLRQLYQILVSGETYSLIKTFFSTACTTPSSSELLIKIVFCTFGSRTQADRFAYWNVCHFWVSQTMCFSLSFWDCARNTLDFGLRCSSPLINHMTSAKSGGDNTIKLLCNEPPTNVLNGAIIQQVLCDSMHGRSGVYTVRHFSPHCQCLSFTSPYNFDHLWKTVYWDFSPEYKSVTISLLQSNLNVWLLRPVLFRTHILY